MNIEAATVLPETVRQPKTKTDAPYFQVGNVAVEKFAMQQVNINIREETTVEGTAMRLSHPSRDPAKIK